MKYLLNLFPVALAALLFVSCHHSNPIQQKQSSSEEASLKLAAWQNARFADPATGEIPSMGLWHAYQQLVADGKIAKQDFVNHADRNVEWELVNDFFDFPGVNILPIHQ